MKGLVLTAGFGPINNIIEDIFPQERDLGFYVVEMQLLSGFGVLVAAVICEKLLQQFIVLQFRQMVDEREALHELRFEEFVRQSLDTGLSRNQKAVQDSEPRLQDIQVQTAAERYFMVSRGQKHFFEGQLRWLCKALEKLGMLSSVDAAQTVGEESIELLKTPLLYATRSPLIAPSPLQLNRNV